VSLAFYRPTPVQVGVFDIVGRRVRILADEAAASGHRLWTWDGRDDDGQEAGPGCYFVRIHTPEGTESRLVTRLR
jgi:flagellar hook assembly protein FlgD